MKENIIYKIGDYTASQVLGNDITKVEFAVSFDESNNITIVGIDARVADFKLLLTQKQKEEFGNLIQKAIEWDEKSKEKKLHVKKKEVGVFPSNMSVASSASIQYADNANCIILFKCDYNNDTFNSGIYLFTPDIQITVEGGVNVTIPRVFLEIDINNVKELSNLISDEYIINKINEEKERSDYIDDILN
ncbi:MAG: hypothetical protein FWF53_05705 [Candidatus Azobacteroides sp.]|nr:hypothetical protein [Candidatus Azobacteroides sp.]